MSSEQIYLFRRKGFSDYSTCDRYRYVELSHHKLFETMICYSGDLQQRLTAAEQRNAELVELLRKARRSIDPSCAGKSLRMELDASLKPTESGARE